MGEPSRFSEEIWKGARGEAAVYGWVNPRVQFDNEVFRDFFELWERAKGVCVSVFCGCLLFQCTARIAHSHLMFFVVPDDLNHLMTTENTAHLILALTTPAPQG
eukprot:TRINITY_DN21024_c5_g1_i1.p2 TRINITY_DN21024_c5_g1~~TRINITY_DN21024_c5_g1_i1.p2  ORF type:complete len:104 (-),score=8.65 TRINITY_DN21024_c5_g1_i1:670-981(-)